MSYLASSEYPFYEAKTEVHSTTEHKTVLLSSDIGLDLHVDRHEETPPFEHWCLSSKSLLQDTKHSPHHMALHREGLEGTVSGIVLRAEAALVRTSTTNLQEKDVMPLIFGILFHKSLCQILTFCYTLWHYS